MFTIQYSASLYFSGHGTNYFSCIAMKYKISSIITLLHRACNISKNYALFHEEISFLKNYFTNNCYSKLFNYLLKNFLNKNYQSKAIVQTVAKQKIYLNLPFIDTLSNKPLLELKDLYITKKSKISFQTDLKFSE